ncbi:MAG: hypothetical protein AB2L14_22150 [Candidatus Xenobiia bacterium LiM19]
MNTLKEFFHKMRHMVVYDPDDGINDPKAPKGSKKKGKEIKDPKAPQKAENNGNTVGETPKPLRTKIITLDELKKKSREISVEHFEGFIPPGEELKLNFDEIFLRANIREPKHGWTIIRVAETVSTPEYELMGMENAKLALAGALKSAKTRPEEILKDAMERDRVLDRFEEFLNARIVKTQTELLDQNAGIEQKILELTRQKEENTERIRREKDYLARWKTEKTEVEKNLARAASYLTTDQVVSIGSVTDDLK